MILMRNMVEIGTIWFMGPKGAYLIKSFLHITRTMKAHVSISQKTYTVMLSYQIKKMIK